MNPVIRTALGNVYHSLSCLDRFFQSVERSAELNAQLGLLTDAKSHLQEAADALQKENKKSTK